MAGRAPFDPEELATLIQDRYDPSEAPEGTFALTVLDGPDAGQSVLLDGTQPSRVLIGTSRVAGLRLSDPRVSRRHAALEICGDELRVTDLGSSNGTRLGNLRVGEVYLRGGETIVVGGSSISVTHSSAEATELVPPGLSFGRMIGASREMRRLYSLLQKLAAADVPVIIEGETGTGKEVLAECLHEQGPRAGAPFVVFDCTAVPANLMESELFGHERGAFTGAVSQRKGVFEQAAGGTLLIDEIGDLELALQGKLLRAVERYEVRRIGGDKWLKVDVRVLCATRRDLDREVEGGRFRDDLYHRLAVARVELPPLRERKGDVTLLARYFARALGGDESALPSELVTRWERQAWAGNVRELRNAVSRWIALGATTEEAGIASGARTQAIDLFERVLSAGLPLAEARQKVVEDFERRYIERVLEAHGGNVSAAAAASGVARRYFQILRNKRDGS